MEQELQTFRIASWYQRLIGFLIDYMIGVGMAAIYMEANRSDFWGMSSQEKNGLTQGAALIFFLLYCLISEGIFNKTIGKLVTCTVVRRRKTLAKVSFLRIVGRTLCRLIPFDALSFVSSKPLGWHDAISGTVVVNSIYNYEAFYGRIKQINKGYLRIHLILSIIAGILTLGFGFIGYWIVVRLVLWIIDGFNEDKKKNYA